MYTEEEASTDDGQARRDTITRGTPDDPPQRVYPVKPEKSVDNSLAELRTR